MPIQRITSGILADGAILATDIADGIVTNAKLAGSITSDKITSVSNTAIAGLIQSAQIGSVSNTALPTGSVLQVVSATKTDTFSTATTGSFVDVTGLSVSITPSTATNKILVFYNISGTNNNNQAWFSLFRGATQISVGIAAGSRLQVSGGNFYDGNVSSLAQWGSTFLDSPATTSATTYKLAVRSGSATTFVNRSNSYSDTTDHGTAVSTITVMEIAA
jgi:hypothetical protein